MTLYTVSLQDAETLPSAYRIKAECIFAGTLERMLGGDEGVARTYRAWLEASECTADVLTADLASLASRWPGAARDAEQAALRDIGHFEGRPHFDIRLPRMQG